MHNVLIKKGVAVEPTEVDNYSEFYPELYVKIKKHLLVCQYLLNQSENLHLIFELSVFF